ncbi:hypothetical protein M0805_001451 [Coniferiporia weirii]|nr:hypothetical protein M0805_001451 [Coniferiporia weirii]
MTWNKSFKQGISLFRARKFEEALEKFNLALGENDKEKSIYDSRAAVYEKLDRPFDALKDSKKVIDIAPDSWQGYMRSARLFLHIGKPEASLRMSDLALERLKSNDEKRHAELCALRIQALKDLEPPPCFFSKIPVEICSEIFSLVTDRSNAKVLALTLVCRRWREIILNTPSLWRYLVLTPKSKGKKVDTWLQRSKGTLYGLQLSKGFSFDIQPHILRHAAENLWSKLETLRVYMPPSIKSIDSILPPNSFGRLQLHSLEIDLTNTPALPPDFWDPVGNMDKNRLKTLVLSACTIPWEHLLNVVSLTVLNVREVRIEYDKAFSVISRNLLLETLVLTSSAIRFEENSTRASEKVVLPSLRSLDLTGPSSLLILTDFRFPNLQTLSVSSAFGLGAARFLYGVTASPLPYLTSLRISSCVISHAPLVALLRTSSALERLVLAHCSPVEETSFVIAALADLIPDSSTKTDGSLETVCCPRLQYLDVTAATHLKAGPILRLVKAHLVPSGTPLEEGSELPSSGTLSHLLPIRTLILDDCIAVDPDVLPWLRTKVERVTCTIKQEKKKKSRR